MQTQTLQRANSMLHRYRGGVVPAASSSALADVGDLASIAAGLPERVAEAMDAYDPRRALNRVWELVAAANGLVDRAQPWALYKAEKAGDTAARKALDAVLYALLEAVRLVAVHLEPFVPGASARLLTQLSLPSAGTLPYAERVRWGGLSDETRTVSPAPLFPKLELSDVASIQYGTQSGT